MLWLCAARQHTQHNLDIFWYYQFLNLILELEIQFWQAIVNTLPLCRQAMTFSFHFSNALRLISEEGPTTLALRQLFDMLDKYILPSKANIQVQAPLPSPLPHPSEVQDRFSVLIINLVCPQS